MLFSYAHRIDSLPDLLNKWGVPRPSINYALAATLVAAGVTMDDAAKQVGAKNGNVVRRGLARKGVTARTVRDALNSDNRVKSLTFRVASQASELLKEDMSGILSRHTKALGNVPARSNLAHLAKVGAALEPLARAAKIVHNWGESGPNGVVLVGEMDGTDRAPIDIPSTDVKLVSTSVEVTPQETAKSREFDL